MSLKEIEKAIVNLPPEEFAELQTWLSTYRPKPLKGSLAELAGTIDPSDIEIMRKAIEEGCEQVDIESWL